MTHVEILMSDNEFGISLDAEQLTAECAKLEECYTEVEGDGYSVTVRPPRSDEAAGTYIRMASGNLQILGYSLDIEDAAPGLEDISRAAFELYCKRA